jgi:hypothetical protein
MTRAPGLLPGGSYAYGDQPGPARNSFRRGSLDEPIEKPVWPSAVSREAGRDTDAHFKLEDEERAFTHQSRLAWRSFWGGLIGSVIGAVAAFLVCLFSQ